MKSISKRKKRFILKHFNDENFSRLQIAKVLKVSINTVYRVYKKYAGCNPYELPEVLPCGRKKRVFTELEVNKVLEYRSKYKCNCNSIELLLKQREGITLAHNQVYKVLKNKGLLHVSKKKRKRNTWTRFERKHSLSLWQTDWKKLKNGNWIIAFKDDASRLIVAYGEFSNATAENSVKVLIEGIKRYGKPKAILTGRDVQFYSSDKKGKASGKTLFQLFLETNHIKHVLARVNHPQTCGKIERFFGEVQRRLYSWNDFQTLDEVVEWYNNLLPNMSLRYEELETPAQAFKRKMHYKTKLIKHIIEVKQ
jgi:putative transposase